MTPANSTNDRRTFSAREFFFFFLLATLGSFFAFQLAQAFPFSSAAHALSHNANHGHVKQVAGLNDSNHLNANELLNLGNNHLNSVALVNSANHNWHHLNNAKHLA